MSQSTTNTPLEDDLIADFDSLDLDPAVYSHDIAVKEITSFYEFISRMHPEDTVCLSYPPSTGSAHITHETFAPRSAAVIELLRHLPYIADGTSIMSHTQAHDYSDENLYGNISTQAEDYPDFYITTDDSDDEDRLPYHIVPLAHAENSYGYEILLDTERGVNIWCVKDGDFLPRDDPSGNGIPPGDANSPGTGVHWWQKMPQYKIKTFFEICKEQLRILNWIPFMEGGGEVWSLGEHQKFDGGDGMDRRAQIMKDCGWPGDGEGRGWDRERAQRETEECEELYG